MTKKEVAVKNDNRIYEMASYVATKGLTETSSLPVIMKKFSELKGLLLRGEFDIDTLENDICDKWGITGNKPIDSLREMSEDLKKKGC